MLAHKMDTVGRIHGVEQETFGAVPCKFDEELTQTDLSDFIAAICGSTRAEPAVNPFAATKRPKTQPVAPIIDIKGPIVPVVEIRETVKQTPPSVVSIAPFHWKPTTSKYETLQ